MLHSCDTFLQEHLADGGFIIESAYEVSNIIVLGAHADDDGLELILADKIEELSQTPL